MPENRASLDTLSADPLIAAAIRLRPRHSLAEAVVMSGMAWRISFCSPGCRCAEQRAAEGSRAEDLARLGLRRGAGAGTDICVSRAPRGHRRRRDLDALLEMAAWSLRPTVRDWCVTAGACVPVAFGPAVYAEVRGSALGAGSDRLARLAEWSATRRATASWLLERAGRQRTPYAIRLRRAGEWLNEEAENLALSCAVSTASDPRDAAEAASRGIVELTEAALMEAGVTPHVRDELLSSPDEPMAGPLHHEILYLARAGRRPLRVLAARRLAGARGAQTEATLGQLLWDSYPPLADAALWALGRIDSGMQVRVAFSVARGMLQDDPAALRAPLLCLLSSARPPGTEEAIESLTPPEVQETLRPEVRALISRLNDHSPDV